MAKMLDRIKIKWQLKKLSYEDLIVILNFVHDEIKARNKVIKKFK